MYREYDIVLRQENGIITCHACQDLGTLEQTGWDLDEQFGIRYWKVSGGVAFSVGIVSSKDSDVGNLEG